MKKNIIIAFILTVFSISAFAGGMYSPVVFYDNVSTGLYQAVSNITVSGLTNTSFGAMTSGAYSVYYRINGTNIKGRLPISAVTNIAFTGSATGTNAVLVTWKSVDGMIRHIVERSANGTDFTNWVAVAPLTTNYYDYGTNVWTNGTFTNLYAEIPAPVVPWGSSSASQDFIDWTNREYIAAGSNAVATGYGAAYGRGAKGTNYGAAVGHLADGSTEGAAIGKQATGLGNGAAVGASANGSDYGAAVGNEANGSTGGAAIGHEAVGSYGGAAVGQGAKAYLTGNFALGQNAIANLLTGGFENTGELGAGSATNNGWLHFRGYAFVDTLGKVPAGCISGVVASASSATSAQSVTGVQSGLLENISSDYISKQGGTFTNICNTDLTNNMIFYHRNLTLPEDETYTTYFSTWTWSYAWAGMASNVWIGHENYTTSTVSDGSKTWFKVHDLYQGLPSGYIEADYFVGNALLTGITLNGTNIYETTTLQGILNNGNIATQQMTLGDSGIADTWPSYDIATLTLVTTNEDRAGLMLISSNLLSAATVIQYGPVGYGFGGYIGNIDNPNEAIYGSAAGTGYGGNFESDLGIGVRGWGYLTPGGRFESGSSTALTLNAGIKFDNATEMTIDSNGTVRAEYGYFTNLYTTSAYTSKSTTNGFQGNEYVSADYVRNLFSGGTLLYNVTNAHPANALFYQAVTIEATNLTTQVRVYTNNNPVGTNLVGQYLGSGIMSTSKYNTIYSPMTVNAYLALESTTGGKSFTIHPEFYYSFDGTNLAGDFTGNPQTISSTTTSLYSWVVAFPNVSASSNFYVLRRFKIDAVGGSGAAIKLHGSGTTPSTIGFAIPPSQDCSLGIRGATNAILNGNNSTYDQTTRTLTLPNNGLGFTGFSFRVSLSTLSSSPHTNEIVWCGTSYRAGTITNINWFCAWTNSDPTTADVYISTNTVAASVAQWTCVTGLTFGANTAPSNLAVAIPYTANQRFGFLVTNGVASNAYVVIEGLE